MIILHSASFGRTFAVFFLYGRNVGEKCRFSFYFSSWSLFLNHWEYRAQLNGANVYIIFSNCRFVSLLSINGVFLFLSRCISGGMLISYTIWYVLHTFESERNTRYCQQLVRIDDNAELTMQLINEPMGKIMTIGIQ